MNKYLNSKYLLYFFFFIMLLAMLSVKYIHFEPIEIGNINQILHPEYAKGALPYSPHLNYDYIVALVAKSIGNKDNFTQLAKLFWFLEMFFAIGVLISLCNFVFKKDKMILVVVIMLFILSSSGQIDQKTMLVPFYLAAIYYFLREKWFMSALFGASLFYLHVGLAIWWGLPSCFALALMFLIDKRVSLKQIIQYLLVLITAASPILIFYLGRVQTSGVDTFSIKYYYHVCWYASSLLLTLRNFPWLIVSTIMLAVLAVGYAKAKQAGYKVENIMPLVMGVLIIFIINFIFADILQNGTAITLQLLRSIVYIQFFSALFFAFILAKQIKKGNYVFCLIFVLFLSRTNIFGKFLGDIPSVVALNVFYLVLLIYEIFEDRILNLAEGLFGPVQKKIDLGYAKEILSNGRHLLQQPITIAVLFIFLATPKPFSLLKQQMRAVLDIPIPPPKVITIMTKHKALYQDMIEFTNQKITNKEALLLTPFLETDFRYYSNHKIFLTYGMPLASMIYENKGYKVKNILAEDLNYHPDSLFEDYSDARFREKWRKLWINLDETIIRRLKKKYGITHVIRERSWPLRLPILYQNQYYIIYEIK